MDRYIDRQIDHALSQWGEIISLTLDYCKKEKLLYIDIYRSYNPRTRVDCLT
jgi:hypothetical protein